MKCIGDATRTIINLTETQRNIVKHLQTKQTHSDYARDISDATGYHPITVFRNLKTLCSLGIVDKCIPAKRGKLRGAPSHRYRLNGEVKT